MSVSGFRSGFRYAYPAGVAVFALALVLGVEIWGGSVRDFLWLEWALMFVLPLFAVLLATRNLRLFWAGLSAVADSGLPCSEELRGQAASLFRFLSRVTGLLCGLWALVALIVMLMNISPGQPPTWGAPLYGAMISALYGLFLIAGVFEPAVFILKKRRGW